MVIEYYINRIAATWNFTTPQNCMSQL